MTPRITVCCARTVRAVATPSNTISNALPRRTFCSTPAVHALGPQSPNYIDVPKPLQPTFPLEPVTKGHLPVPRDVFRTRNAHPKESSVFLARTTRSPKDRKAPGPHSRDAEYQLYRQRLADKRRIALHEGLKQLHERKTATEAQSRDKLVKMRAIRRELALAPPRTVDTLTQTSISPTVRMFLADRLRSSSRSNVTSARRAAYQRRIESVQSVRKSQLHDLYTNAREFIVDEQQLDQAIENAFGTDESPMGWDIKGNMGPRTEGKEGLSPWHGPMPEGVGDMLQKLRGGEGVGLAKDRVRKVAEVLTGGKM